MQRVMTAILISTMGLSTACVASRSYVRNEVQASSDHLSARMDNEDKEMGEVRDGVQDARDGVKRVDDRVTGVDSRVSNLDSTTGQLKGDVQTLDQKTSAAQTS